MKRKALNSGTNGFIQLKYFVFVSYAEGKDEEVHFKLQIIKSELPTGTKYFPKQIMK